MANSRIRFEFVPVWLAQVRGPLNLPRSPQGHPLIVQAGSSEDGKGLAARYAEAVFTAQQTLDDAFVALTGHALEDARDGEAG